MSLDTTVERSTKVRHIEADMVEAGRNCKRQPYVMGTAMYPTGWDLSHRYLDRLLDDWQAAR